MATAFGAVTMPDIWAATCSVNVGSGVDSGNCQGSPCRTISYTMSQSACSVIHIANGTYSTATGESWPHLIDRNLELAGSGSDCSGPCTKIFIPRNIVAFQVSNTALSSTTKIHDLNLTADASGTGTTNAIDFFVGSVAMSPEIYNNTFDGNDPSVGNDAILISDSSSANGTFTGSIHNNVFMNWDRGVQIEQSAGGSGDNFSPTISNNTFTHDSYAFLDSVQTGGGGTNSPTVTGNTFLADKYDVFDYIYPGDDFTHHLTVSGNSFGADPNDSSVSSPASSSAINIYWYGGYQGDANHTQTYNDEIRNNVIRSQSTDIVGGLYPEQDASNTPVTFDLTIDGNTMDHAGNAGVSLSEAESNSSSAGLTTYNVNVTNNRISNAQDSDAVKVAGGETHKFGPVSNHTTISGNTITQSEESGILVSFTSLSSLKSADYHVTINNNTMTDAAPSRSFDTAIEFKFQPSGNASETLDFAINGNQMTNWDYGIYVPFEEMGSMPSVSGTIAGNTITGSTVLTSSAFAAMSMTFSSFSSVGAGTIKINDNYVAGNAINGMNLGLLTTGTNPVSLCCNTIINNASDGILLYQPSPTRNQGSPAPHLPVVAFATPDFGGGANTSGSPSPGLNVIHGNNTSNGGYFDVENLMPVADGSVAAHNNYWGTTNTATIDSHIYDNLDNSSVGRVDYGTGTNNGNGPLSSAPAATYNAVISGPSTAGAGAIVTFTAVITATGDCGEAAVVFRSGPPSLGTLVVGSATTTMGNVVSPLVAGDNMVIVNIGYMDPGGISELAKIRPLDGSSVQATVTWKVQMPNTPGTVDQQGTVTTEPGGSSDTNTVATTVEGQEVVNTPTLGQWGMMMFLLLLGLAGAFALRRRRYSGAAFALILAVGIAGAAHGAPGAKRHTGDHEYHVGMLNGSTTQVLGHRPNGSAVTGIQIVLSDGLNAVVADNRYRVVDTRAGVGHAPAADRGISRLASGEAVLVDLERRKDGTVKKATVVVFDSLAKAQAKFDRKTSR